MRKIIKLKEKRAFNYIEKTIFSYTDRQFSAGITRKEAEYFSTKLNPTEKILLLKSSDDLSNKIKRLNIEAIQNVKVQLTDIVQSEKSTEEKIVQIQALVLEQEGATQDMLINAFTAVLIQNEEIIERNKHLKNQIEFLQEQVSDLSLELERAGAEQR